MVEISLEIPKGIYDQIIKLSETFSQDVEETINEVLDAACFDVKWLVESKKKDVIPISVMNKISNRLDSGRMIDNSLFKNVLKELDADGLFRVSDMTLDLEDNSIWIHYDGLEGSNLFVHSFDVTITGLWSLTADYLVEVDEEDDATLWKVEEHAKRIERTRNELPVEFRELDPWEISVSSDDATFFYLRAEFSEPSLDNLPSIPAISEFFEKVLASAGVNRSS